VPVVDVWNGTRTVGLSRIASDAVVAAGLKVGTIASARTTYPTTLIITADAQKYQQTLVTLQGFVPGTVIAEMPAGEAAMRGDILVIVGEDYQP
ncbi:LytR C-terminal domain-containing protein, partial [Patescibacteria group bacterium]|nr:LytR C-terminal domain-containing protein [Patescibacteria group bacterium]MBU1448665.1 LytR C-terminal domain-containing protein [Patescibacteria group bacterium]